MHIRHALACTLLLAVTSAVSSLPAQHETTQNLGKHTSQNPLEAIGTQNLKLSLDKQISLEVNITSFHHGEWVEVKWAGVEDPSWDDYIALVAPAGADIRQTTPVKYQWCIKSASHLEAGHGLLRFRLLNMREPVTFAFLRHGLAFPLLSAMSLPLSPFHPNEPLQIHLTLTASPREMLVQWTTKHKHSPQVKWGIGPGEHSNAAAADFETYTREELCGPPATTIGWYEPGILHHAVMTGLEPGTRYHYIVGDEAFGFSREASFMTPPVVNAESPVKFLAIADLGQAEIDGSNEQSEMLPSLNTTQRMAVETDYHQLLIHNGDISYARGFATQWENYADQMAPLTSIMPYICIPGNHERDWPNSGDRFEALGPVYDSGGECGKSFERRYRMPLPGTDKWWFAFDFGPIRFLQYSTEHDFSPGSEQHEFMLRELRAVNRTLQPWVVVGGHRPIYVDSTYDVWPDGDQPVARALREAFEEMFLKYSVDMTWHGHHHSYQRTAPVFQGKRVQDNPDGSKGAPVHLVMGHAGAGLSYNVKPNKPAVFEVVKVEHGYMRVQANGTAFTVEVVSDVDGSLQDAFTLTKPLGWQPRDPELIDSWRPGNSQHELPTVALL